MSNVLEMTTRSAEETQDLGRRLGAYAERGDLLLLSGELGSGKTTLSQGIAWGLGVDEYAHSPTFVLVNEYQGRLVLFHVDLYRLDDLAEVQELGIEEMLADGVCVVEWAEKAVNVLPRQHLLVEIEVNGQDDRRLRLTPHGEHYDRLLKRVRSLAEAG
jgi:tRNA threonylcarbamoyladenosine biosynthesis protein TsaE